jgi:hypothetical protein
VLNWRNAKATPARRGDPGDPPLLGVIFEIGSPQQWEWMLPNWLLETARIKPLCPCQTSKDRRINLWGVLNQFSDRIVRSYRQVYKKDAKVVTVGSRDLYLKANYQDFARFQEVDLAIAGDGEASLPALTEAVKRLIDEGRKSAGVKTIETRG